MSNVEKDLQARLDHALGENDLERVAAILALGKLGEPGSEADLPSFDAIAEALPRMERKPRRHRFWFAPLVLGLGAAAVLLLTVQVTEDPLFEVGSSLDASSQRLKGTVVLPCGDIRIVVQKWTDLGPVRLPSRQLSRGGEIVVSVVPQRTCWSAVYLVGLSGGSFEVVNPFALTPVENEKAPLSKGHQLVRPGRYVLAAIGTQERADFSRDQVIALLRALGRGDTPLVSGEEVSMDIYEIEVK